MQRSEFPPHRSVCQVHQTVKKRAWCANIELGGLEGLAGLSPPVERGAFLPLISEYSFRIGAKIAVAVVDTHTRARAIADRAQALASRRRSKFRRRVKARKHIRNAIDRRRFVAAVARDMRFYIALVRSYDRVLRVAVSLSERERSGRARELNEIFLPERRYPAGWICGAPSNARTGRNAARVRLMYRAVTIINVSSAICYDKLQR